MNLVKLPTQDGPIYLNPEHVTLVRPEPKITVIHTENRTYAITAPLEEVVETLLYGGPDLPPFPLEDPDERS